MGQAHRRRFGIGVAAVLAVAAAGCTGGDTQADETAAPSQTAAVTRVQLPPHPKVGQSSQGQYDISVSVRIETDSEDTAEKQDARVKLGYSAKVVDVGENGTYTGEITFTNLRLVDSSTTMRDLRHTLQTMPAFTVRQEHAANGSVRGEPEIVDAAAFDQYQLQAVHDFIDTISSAPPAYAKHPVGEGDTWDVDTSVTKNGVKVPVTTHYTLQKLADKTFTISYRTDTSIDTTMQSNGQQMDVSGQLTGSGHITGSTTNPLNMVVKSHQKVDMTVESEGQTTHIHKSVKLRSTNK